MSDWEAKTPPESISAMRVAVEANTATCNKSLEWAVKTYALVAPLAASNERLEKRVVAAERRVRIQGPWAILAASLALAASFVGLACELIR